ncbi:MAG: hypothetical protein ILO53_04805 [Clostridia bacterium]|nr:hypothetical protein [Clostridia bacterium]
MKKLTSFLKKEIMLVVAVVAAAASLFITPPSAKLLQGIDWRTLGILLMMLCVLEGFKQESVLAPVVALGSRLKKLTALTFFLVFGVFFSSMFVTNDVSLILFVPITIMVFRGGGKEKYILPVITLQNIAAIRGSLLTPFGSPQNLFLYGQVNVTVWHFMLHMLPLCAMSAVLLAVFILILYRRNPGESIEPADTAKPAKDNLPRRIVYVVLFCIVVLTVVTRFRYWYFVLAAVLAAVAFTDVRIFKKVDYVLLVTFLCFFIFSQSVGGNERIAAFLSGAVAGREYWWSLGLSQIISNVPSTIVLYPFSQNFAGLIYGADTAGLCSIIGSLASVINYRIYIREYPGTGKRFMLVFTLISWAFFLIVVIPGLLLSRWAFF